mmetsp:Transcript_26525/g.71059  ORF Transcript_26525/g.71059 Transcript_26525/m.71059 type:complete len:307 (-) Transcript_26525:1785-2705(-)
MAVLHLAHVHDEEGHVREVDEAAHTRLQGDHLTVGRSVEGELAVGDVELEAEAVARGDGLDLVRELPKLVVQSLAHLTLTLLGLQLVRVVHRRASVEGLARLHDLGEKLNVLRLLLAHHDRVLEVKVDDDHDLALARLEEGVLDVCIHDVHNVVGLGGREAKAVGVGVEVADGLAAGQRWAHGEVGEARDPLVLHLDQLGLHHQVRLLRRLVLALARSLAQLLDQAELVRERGRVERAVGELLHEGEVLGLLVLLDQRRHLFGRVLADRLARREKVDAEVGRAVRVGHGDVLDRRDVEWNGLAVDR